MTETILDRPAPALSAAMRRNTIAKRVRTISKLLIHLALILGGVAVLIPFFLDGLCLAQARLGDLSDAANMDP